MDKLATIIVALLCIAILGILLAILVGLALEAPWWVALTWGLILLFIPALAWAVDRIEFGGRG